MKKQSFFVSIAKSKENQKFEAPAMEVIGEASAAQTPHTRARFIKKRALKNKALAVSFDEKDLRDYVGGFHKRKKKRRKEAQNQLQEALRRKRIELRKKRKLERDYVQNGGAPPGTDSGPDEGQEEDEQDDENEPIASVSGTKTYDNGETQVTVTTMEISREEDQSQVGKPQAAIVRPIGVAEKKHNVPVVSKKPFKKVAKQHKSRPKLQKREKRKGKTNNSNKRAR